MNMHLLEEDTDDEVFEDEMRSDLQDLIDDDNRERARDMNAELRRYY